MTSTDSWTPFAGVRRLSGEPAAVHAFPPRSTAGVEVLTLRLARALRARGHDVRILRDLVGVVCALF